MYIDVCSRYWLPTQNFLTLMTINIYTYENELLKYISYHSIMLLNYTETYHTELEKLN